MEQEITLDLRDIFDILKKRLKLILVITILATIISGVVSFFILDPVYESKTSIVIGKDTSGIEGANYNVSDITMYQKLIKTYGEIAKSYDVAIRASAKLNGEVGAKEIQNMSTITPQADTQILVIKVQNKDPYLAKKIVDALTESFIEASKEPFPEGNVAVIDTAIVPENPIKPNKKMNVLIAFMLGLMVSVGLSFLLEFMDSTVKTASDIEESIGLPVIGTIPYYSEK